MSAAADTDSPRLPPHPVRPFYWSVRRELWENRAVYLAPLAVAALFVGAFLFGGHNLVHELKVAAGLAPPRPPPANLDPAHAATWMQTAPGRAKFALMVVYFGSCAALLGTAVIVGVFYCLGALYGERRDRTVLFWKSLPVSDTTTVLSKLFVPLVILPVVAVATTFVVHAFLLAISAVILAGAGLPFGLLWGKLELPIIWALFPYAVATMVIWWAPIVAWLMAVSAWAKRMTFVWAIAPPLAVCLVERVALGTHYAWDVLKNRLAGGDIAFAPHPHNSLPTPDMFRPLQFLADPGVWGGLIVFAGLVAASIWLRRRRDPI